jgi:hypothetical protein
MKEVNENFSVRARPLSEYSFLEVQVYTEVTDKLWEIADLYTEKIYLELGYSSKQLYELKQTEEWAKLALELKLDLNKSLIKGFRSQLMVEMIEKMINNANK